MLIIAFVALATLSLPGALAAQISVVDGVVGGVPKANLAPARPNVPMTSPTAPGKLRAVENSGAHHREMTPGVYQASGYGDLTAMESMWFWFFAARSNPSTAPLALWFNGGPGSSSMIGLFQEHGPCRITNDSSSVTLNPYSWNNNANVLYIDQPVGAGFSHGTLNVGTSQEAASDVWKFMQIFFSDPRFAKYATNDLAIWTESYGGHYGPTFAAYILSQNSAIAAGTISGIRLNLKVLGIGDGLTDPLVQYPGYIVYAASNPYHPLVSSSVISRANTSWTRTSATGNAGCKEQLEIMTSVAAASIASHPYPPDVTTYLNTIGKSVGAESTWQETNFQIYANFANTGDWMRNSRPDLETVINAGVRTIIFDGDADYILNYVGVEAMVDALDTKFASLYKQQTFKAYTVAGQATGQYKNAGTFSYVRIYGAGHEVPAYKFGNLAYGQAAAQMFTQIMSNQPLTPT
ncbi:hypothetical protein NLJ89_g8961 [Agrocybe chaxingu]|uniref:Carboxypeptidase n=1 Tax=Agrocybe chaxingu TaxID=84603 RepID=A0A9W8MSA5_9AGAR|nr:hypothetical protein NLJ89_g8961 [Agrocybe chaxingu]